MIKLLIKQKFIINKIIINKINSNNYYLLKNLKIHIKNKTLFDNLYMDCNSIIYDSIQKIYCGRKR